MNYVFFKLPFKYKLYNKIHKKLTLLSNFKFDEAMYISFLLNTFSNKDISFILSWMYRHRDYQLFFFKCSEKNLGRITSCIYVFNKT